MRKAYKLFGISIAVIIVTLILTNPTAKDFKEYIGISEGKYFDLTLQRTHNYIIFSTYTFNYISTATEDELYMDEPELRNKRAVLNNLIGNYTGFFSNFYKNP